ncbi:CBU_0592 family membrane protein [Micromonospora sp. CPCC 206061]|uniref:CBU_0592 family membrane protein n=1 Tax=Micromonospora sp. CPCC 206061 TaxID=3122410 RepID=UPI002FEEE195
MTGTLAEVAGWGGAALLLLAYLLLSMGRIAASRAFQAMNLLGSLGLAVNALVHGAWPSATLNAIWLVIALNGVLLGAERAGRQPAHHDRQTR